jgi:hypothetical protein
VQRIVTVGADYSHVGHGFRARLQEPGLYMYLAHTTRCMVIETDRGNGFSGGGDRHHVIVDQD